jgi:hypothetical protein
MSILYDEGKAKGDFNWGRVQKMNPNSQWATHSYNHFVLAHIAKASKDFNERWQARKEMDVAERKMTFWERQDMFDEAQARFYRKKFYRM